MFQESQKNNVKLKGLDRQMGELDDDFNNMLRAREEARRKLEEKFKNVYDNIKENKDFMISTGKEFNEKLKVYQNEFNVNLESARHKLSNHLDTETNKIEESLVQTDDRMLKLEQEIQVEKEERKADWDKQLKEIDRNFNNVKQGFSDETKNRTAKKKNVLNAMAEGNAKVSVPAATHQ